MDTFKFILYLNTYVLRIRDTFEVSEDNFANQTERKYQREKLRPALADSGYY